MRKNRTAIKNFKYLGIFLLISLLFIQTLSSSIYNSNENSTSNPKNIQNEKGLIETEGFNLLSGPVSQDTSNLLQYSYYNNLTGIREWISEDLVNNQSEGLF